MSIETIIPTDLSIHKIDMEEQHERVPGLSIYKKKGTRFWWMRVKVGPWKVEKSTKMLDKNAAYQLAKQVHDKLMVQYINMQLGINAPMDNLNMRMD